MHSPQVHRYMRRGTAAGGAAVLAALSLLATGCDRPGESGHAQAGQASAPAFSLEEAIARGDDEAVRSHISAGTPIDTVNFAGDTPLSVASVMGRTYAVEALIAAGASLEAKNAAGATPLFNAAFFCHADVVQVLIDAGAETDTADQNGTSIKHAMEMPWAQIEPVYAAVYGAIGIPFDAERIEAARPQIAAMLR